MGCIAEWLREIDEVYRSSDRGTFGNRLAGWRGSADQVVLTYGIFRELRALRKVLEGMAAKKSQR